MFVILRKLKNVEKLMPFQQVINYAKYTKTLIGAEERRALLEKQRFESVRASITSALKNRKSLSVLEFKTIEAELRSKINDFKYGGLHRYVFDVLLSLRRPNDSMENMRNYMEAFDIKYDLSTKMKIIQLYAKKASESKLNEKEEQELIGLCDEFIAQEFHALPDLNSIVVMGLCATKDWRKAFELQPQYESSVNILARKILRENDIDLAWTVLNRLTKLPKHHQRLASRTIDSFTKYFNRNPAHIPINADKLFSFCEKLKMLFIEPSIKELTNVLERHGHHAKITNMNYSGVCNECQSQLETVHVTDLEFSGLQKEFINKVVKGADIYQKTTPKEWESFERVIKENGPFDIVMDGLNVSYGANKFNVMQRSTNNPADGKLKFSNAKERPCAYSLANAVEKLTTEGKRVLVIGREHMNRWPKIDYIGQIATVFLVENISKDDVFLLYAAIHSGQNSYILSNDYMRQHKFAIGGKYNELFKLWQQEHWYGFIYGENKQIELVKPMQHKMHIHKVNEFWHLPYKPNEALEAKMWNSYELPENWACIRIKSKC